jgi:hypothetical protein
MVGTEKKEKQTTQAFVIDGDAVASGLMRISALAFWRKLEGYRGSLLLLRGISRSNWPNSRL